MDAPVNDSAYSIVLSDDQRQALGQVEHWLESGEPRDERFTLGGFAGTGKTTLIKYVLAQAHGRMIGVCAFTGKAAYVLRSKGIDATTMHRMIYAPTVRCQACGAVRSDFIVATLKTGCEHKKVDKDWLRHPSLPYDLIIVDEASMVNRRLMEDLESFQIPVLYVGDHGQLEPIGDNPGLMLDPDVRLEQIHRQAESSPILKLAHHVRQGFRPETMGDAARVLATGVMPKDAPEFDIILCGFNSTRVAINKKIRQHFDRTGPGPVPGDRLICLRNAHDQGMFNGQLFTCLDVRTANRGGHEISVLDCVDDLGDAFESIAYVPAQFGAIETMRDANPKKVLFDWGYCITAHKCVAGDTLVVTNSGLHPIRDVPPTGEILTIAGMRHYYGKIENPPGRLLKITCNDGHEITVTPDHRLRTSIALEWRWMQADELIPGMVLRRFEGGPQLSPVYSIEETSGPSFCLTVPSTGSFLQNGFDGGNSQGSEWRRVLALEQIGRNWEPARWRYTAITRASEEIVYCVSPGRRIG
jgi:exodeoxyribonuclease-5